MDHPKSSIASCAASLLGAALLVLTAMPSAAQNRVSTALSAPGAGGVQTVDSIVAVVNDDIITRRDLNSRVRAAEQQLQRGGGTMPPREILERQVLERAVVDKSLSQFAKENGLRADEATIDVAFANLAQQNNLTVPQFKERLEKEGFSLAGFRADLAQEIVLFRLRDREVDSRINVTESEIDAFLAQNDAGGDNTEWNVAQILVAPASDKPADIEAARAKASVLFERASKGEPYEALLREATNSSEATRAGELGFRSRDRMPELFLNAVEKLNTGQIAKPVQSAAGFHVLKLAGKRNAGASASNSAQQTKASHILLRTSPTMTDAQAEAQLVALRARIAGGQTRFEDAAKAFSADGSAAKGGDLGWLLPGDTVPEFENSMNGLKPGEISTPVRSQFGWHLILVQDRRVQEVPADKVRQLAKVQLRERKAEDEYIEFARRIRDKAYVELRLDRQ
jgi:peptidyl-prolyl cis-trans isomerase SurA